MNNSSNLSDNIIIAIIYKESGGDPTAYNEEGGGFGAIGLMQIRSIALKDFNQNWLAAGASWYTAFDLWSPILNIYIGSGALYNDVFRYNHGNVTAGLDWYGTGPGYGQSILDTAAKIPLQGIGAFK